MPRGLALSKILGTIYGEILAFGRPRHAAAAGVASSLVPADRAPCLGGNRNGYPRAQKKPNHHTFQQMVAVSKTCRPPKVQFQGGKFMKIMITIEIALWGTIDFQPLINHGILGLATTPHPGRRQLLRLQLRRPPTETMRCRRRLWHAMAV